MYFPVISNDITFHFLTIFLFAGWRYLEDNWTLSCCRIFAEENFSKSSLLMNAELLLEISATLWGCCWVSHYIQSLSGSAYSTLQIRNKAIHHSVGSRYILSKQIKKKFHQPLGLWWKMCFPPERRSPFEELSNDGGKNILSNMRGFKRNFYSFIRRRIVKLCMAFAWLYKALKCKPKAEYRYCIAIKSRNSRNISWLIYQWNWSWVRLSDSCLLQAKVT